MYNFEREENVFVVYRDRSVVLKFLFVEKVEYILEEHDLQKGELALIRKWCDEHLDELENRVIKLEKLYEPGAKTIFETKRRLEDFKIIKNALRHLEEVKPK